MKHKSLLILASILGVRSDSTSIQEQVSNMKSGSVSWGRVEAGYKSLFYPNTLLIIGADQSLNFYLGVGFFYNTEYKGWPLEFKFIYYCVDWSNKEFSKEYFKKMPINLSISTNVWSFNVGLSASLSINKKFLIAAFVTFGLNDDIDISIHGHVRGENDFFSKNSFSKEAIRIWKRHNEKIVADLKLFYKDNCLSNEQQEKVIDSFINHSSFNIALADHFLEGKAIDYEKYRSDSVFIIGRSGSGKTHIYDIIEQFITKHKLNSIALFKISAENMTPQGFKGAKANEQIETSFNTMIKDCDFKHNQVTLSRCLILIDEIDCISDRGGQDTDDFYTRVQKNLLDFIEGKKFYETSIGKIYVTGCFKLLPGAYESKSGQLEKKVVLNVLSSPNIFHNLFGSLSGYIKDRILKVYDKEIYNRFSELEVQAKIFGEELQSYLNKNSVFQELIKDDKKSAEEVMDELKLEGGIFVGLPSKLKLLKSAKKISNLFRELNDLITNNGFNRNFYDVYTRLFEMFTKFDTLLEETPERFSEFIEIAVERYKVARPLYCIQESGMGAEITRRANGNIVYIVNPSFIEAKKFLYESALGKLLKDLQNRGKLKTRGGCTIDKYMDRLLEYKGNINQKYKYGELSTLIEKEKQTLENLLKYSPNGEIVLLEERGVISIRPKEEDISMKALKKLSQEKQEECQEKIKAQAEFYFKALKQSDLKCQMTLENLVNGLKDKSQKIDDAFLENFKTEIDEFLKLNKKCNTLSAIKSLLIGSKSDFTDKKGLFNSEKNEIALREQFLQYEELQGFVFNQNTSFDQLMKNLDDFFIKKDKVIIPRGLINNLKDLYKEVKKIKKLLEQQDEVDSLENQSNASANKAKNKKTKKERKEEQELQNKIDKLYEEMSNV